MHRGCESLTNVESRVGLLFKASRALVFEEMKINECNGLGAKKQQKKLGEKNDSAWQATCASRTFYIPAHEIRR